MPIEYRTPSPEDLDAIVTFDFRNFGDTVPEGIVEEIRADLDLERFLVAFDGEHVAGVAGSYAMDLTLPGQEAVPMSGVTWVSVSAAYRRQGIARRLMAGLDELADGYGEALLGLIASEGGIYERFGYGSSTRTRVTEIERHRAALSSHWDPEPVELGIAHDHFDTLLGLYDRYRRSRVGEVSRSAALHRIMALDREKSIFAALHPDGYVVYEVEPRWNNGHPAHVLTVKELVAITPEAHLALWNLILSIDLVGTIRSIRTLSLDDPLATLLIDPRAVRTVELNDGLWLKVSDPLRCFGARSYRTDDRLVLGVVEGFEELLADATPTEVVAVDAAGAAHSDDAPDVVLTRAALGPLLMGENASTLALARRLRADEATVRRADAFFGSGVAAHCLTSF